MCIQSLTVSPNGLTDISQQKSIDISCVYFTMSGEPSRSSGANT